VAAISMAQSVTSANVVGYQSLTIKPGFQMLPVNFAAVADTAASIPIQTLFSTNGLWAGQDGNSGDQLQIWNGSVFSVYFYRINKTTNPNKFLYPNSWVGTTNIGVPTVDSLPAGSGYWFNRPVAGGTTTVTVAGQVLTAQTNSFAIQSGFNMIGSAYPVDFPLNTGTPFDWSAATAGQDGNSGDQIQLWNGSTFNVYFYRVNKTTNPNKFLYPNSWVGTTNIGVPTVDAIPAGTGFWYKHVGSSTTLNQTAPAMN
jgi:hypothetical protein